MIALLIAAAVSAAPVPSPTPLRTIVHTRVSPLCDALRENIGHAIAAALGNDGAIAASKPVLVSMSTDNMTPDQIETIGLGNLHSSATVDHNSAAMQLDAQHLEQIIGALTHNLNLIEAQLTDPHRFPKEPKDDADRKALEIKAQLQAVAAQQKQTLDVLNALLDTRSMEALADRGDPLETLFGIDDVGSKLKGGPKVQGTNGEFNGGPLAATPDQQMDPTLKPSEFSALTNSVFGRFYRIVFLEQQAIGKLESPLAQNVIQVSRACNGTP